MVARVYTQSIKERNAATLHDKGDVMFQATMYSDNKTEAYEQLIANGRALFEGVDDDIANLSNASALLNEFLTNINWVGFYIVKSNVLILGPFQGKPACVSINMGRGVCGTAAQTLRTQRIANVHEFPGHIACDEASKSEIVIPLLVGGQLYGVLDIDAPVYDRFDEEDRKGLEEFAKMLSGFLTHN